MPDKVVQIDGVGTVAFPDTMSDDDISKVIQQQHPDLAPKKSVISQALHNLPQSLMNLALSTPGVPRDDPGMVSPAVAARYHEQGIEIPPENIGESTSVDNLGGQISAGAHAAWDKLKALVNDPGGEISKAFAKDPAGTVALPVQVVRGLYELGQTAPVQNGIQAVKDTINAPGTAQVAKGVVQTAGGAGAALGGHPFIGGGLAVRGIQNIREGLNAVPEIYDQVAQGLGAKGYATLDAAGQATVQRIAAQLDKAAGPATAAAAPATGYVPSAGTPELQAQIAAEKASVPTSPAAQIDAEIAARQGAQAGQAVNAPPAPESPGLRAPLRPPVGTPAPETAVPAPAPRETPEEFIRRQIQPPPAPPPTDPLTDLREKLGLPPTASLSGAERYDSGSVAPVIQKADLNKLVTHLQDAGYKPDDLSNLSRTERLKIGFEAGVPPDSQALTPAGFARAAERITPAEARAEAPATVQAPAVAPRIPAQSFDVYRNASPKVKQMMEDLAKEILGPKSLSELMQK